MSRVLTVHNFRNTCLPVLPFHEVSFFFSSSSEKYRPTINVEMTYVTTHVFLQKNGLKNACSYKKSSEFRLDVFKALHIVINNIPQ